MKKLTPRRLLKLILVLVLVLSLGRFGYQLLQYHQGEAVYEEATELVQLPDLEQITQEISQPGGKVPSADTSSASSSSVEDPPAAPVYVDPYADALKNMDFVALRQRNQDVLGWIVIPDTRLSYPLVQGEDNEYYLNHTWRKSRNSVGAIFMECQCKADLSEFNTIVYGHRMNNRSMFGILLNYKKQSYWQQHPKVYITDDSGTHTYEIFAAYEVALDTPTYWIHVSQEADRQTLIDFALEQSVIDTGVVPSIQDRILTLSTCTGNGHDTRWVVQAVEWNQQEPMEPSVEEPQGPVLPEEQQEDEHMQPAAEEDAPAPEDPVPGEEAQETEVNGPEEKTSEEPEMQSDTTG